MVAIASSSSATAAFLLLLAPLLLAAPQSPAANFTLANALSYSQQGATSGASKNNMLLYNANGQPMLTHSNSQSHNSSYDNRGAESSVLSVQAAAPTSGALPFHTRPRSSCARRPGNHGYPGSRGFSRTAGSGRALEFARGGSTSVRQYRHQRSERASQAYGQQSTYSHANGDAYGRRAYAGAQANRNARGHSAGSPSSYAGNRMNTRDRFAGYQGDVAPWGIGNGYSPSGLNTSFDPDLSYDSAGYGDSSNDTSDTSGTGSDSDLTDSSGFESDSDW